MSASTNPPSKFKNPFFPTVLLLSAAFIVTILAMVAGLFGDPKAPIAKYMEENGGRLIVSEVIGVLLVGFLALVTDRIQTKRDLRDRKKDDAMNDNS